MQLWCTLCTSKDDRQLLLALSAHLCEDVRQLVHSPSQLIQWRTHPWLHQAALQGAGQVQHIRDHAAACTQQDSTQHSIVHFAWRPYQAELQHTPRQEGMLATRETVASSVFAQVIQNLAEVLVQFSSSTITPTCREL